MEKGDTMEVIQGALGSGKSAVGHVQAILHLKAGGVVATNYSWAKDWAWKLAGQDLRVWLGLRDRQKLAECLYCRNLRIGSPESMYEASHYLKDALRGSPLGKKREGKGLMVIDEAHHWFNARNWQKNSKYNEFFANARKLGWRVIIITHSIESLDAQVRSRVEYETFFRNLKKVKAPFLPIPLSPVPLFFTITRYSGLGPGRGTKAGQDLYWLDKLAANLYDTTETFHLDNVVSHCDYQGDPPLHREKKSEPVIKKKEPSRIVAWSPLPEYRQIIKPNLPV